MNVSDPRRRFPRAARVRTRAEYTVVFENGRRLSDPLLSLHWSTTQDGVRLGMAVSRKVDTRAVGRNRIKRVLRDTTRHIAPWLGQGDYVVVARSAAAKASNNELRDAFLRVLRRAGALPQSIPRGTMPLPFWDTSSSHSPKAPERRSD